MLRTARSGELLATVSLAPHRFSCDCQWAVTGLLAAMIKGLESMREVESGLRYRHQRICEALLMVHYV